MKRALFLLLAYSLFGISAQAQFETIIIPSIKAHKLAGVVTDPTGAVIPSVMVELVDCPVGRGYPAPENKTLLSIQTDRDGRFSIEPGKLRGPYCLRLSSPDFDNLEVEVHLFHFARQIHLKMHIAS